MDNRTIYEVRKNETKLINEIKVLETEIQKYKEVIDKLEKYIRLTVSEEEFIETEHYVELLDILKEVEQ